MSCWKSGASLAGMQVANRQFEQTKRKSWGLGKRKDHGEGRRKPAEKAPPRIKAQERFAQVRVAKSACGPRTIYSKGWAESGGPKAYHGLLRVVLHEASTNNKRAVVA